MESLLSGGYTSVHTSLGFHTDIFTLKTKEYLTNKDDIIAQIGDLYGEKDEKRKRKVLMNELIELWKQEDKKSQHKLAYKIKMDREEESVKRRAFSEGFKLDMNNQYGFAMTKPLHIAIFKKKPDINLIEMNKIVGEYDPLKY